MDVERDLRRLASKPGACRRHEWRGRIVVQATGVRALRHSKLKPTAQMRRWPRRRRYNFLLHCRGSHPLEEGRHTGMAIPGEKAIQMVRSAHAQAAQMDIAVTAVVVDQSGRMIALGRMDRARPITVEIALNKAYTAASFQQPQQELAGVAGQTWFQSLVVSSNGRIMPGAGALPVVEGGSVVGAIAVAGGTEEQDQRCAEVALASYG